MATRAVLSVPRSEAASVLSDVLAKGHQIHSAGEAVQDEPSFEAWIRDAKRWRAYASSALESICADDALAKEFRGATYAAGVVVSMWDTQSLAERLGNRVDNHVRELEALRSMVDRLELFEVAPEVKEDDGNVADEPPAEIAPTTRVFIVHGRQRGSVDAVARFVDKLGLEPVILDEQANEGRTILEKLEANTEDVGFAVVLLQPDDLARGPDDDDWPAEPNRARQNVILELGFFVGKIGRARVAALVAPGVEQPSDILGLAYIPFDESWQWPLARELKVAYPDVDLNRVA